VTRTTKLTLHPKILECDGKKAFTVLPYEEFVMIEEGLQDYEDLKELRAAKAEEAGQPTVPLRDAKKELGLQERTAARGRCGAPRDAPVRPSTSLGDTRTAVRARAGGQAHPA
jgi:hypothetical protein